MRVAGEGGARGATTLRPKVTFVDLAGSERTKDAGTSGMQQKEGTKINLSLFNLGSVINALGNKDSFVPYNRSVLTKLLQACPPSPVPWATARSPRPFVPSLVP